MAAFSKESLDRIEQAILSHKKRFRLTPECIGMNFTYGEKMEIFAEENDYLCINHKERSTTMLRFSDETAAVEYFIRFIPLALYTYKHENSPKQKRTKTE